MWMLIALLAAPPVTPSGAPPSAPPSGPPFDVTDRMAAPPGKVSLNLTENFILGDPQSQVTEALRAHLGPIEACLQALGPRMVEGTPVGPVDLRISKTGRLESLKVQGGLARTSDCMRRVLAPVQFPFGRTRSGLVELAIARPAPPPIPATVDAIRWTAPGEQLRFAITARRVREPDGRWRLALEGAVTAHGAARGVGTGSLRHTHSLRQADGRSKNGFSLQQSAGVDTCLKAGESTTLTARGVHPVGPGELYSAQVYVLGGDCASGTGRFEIGTVQLDGRAGNPPVLRALPTWSYRLHEQHK